MKGVKKEQRCTSTRVATGRGPREVLVYTLIGCFAHLQRADELVCECLGPNYVVITGTSPCVVREHEREHERTQENARQETQETA